MADGTKKDGSKEEISKEKHSALLPAQMVKRSEWGSDMDESGLNGRLSSGGHSLDFISKGFLIHTLSPPPPPPRQ